jgi:hypothetical protein
MKTRQPILLASIALITGLSLPLLNIFPDIPPTNGLLGRTVPEILSYLGDSARVSEPNSPRRKQEWHLAYGPTYIIFDPNSGLTTGQFLKTLEDRMYPLIPRKTLEDPMYPLPPWGRPQ